MCLAPRVPHSTASMGQRLRTHGPHGTSAESAIHYRIAFAGMALFSMSGMFLGLGTIRRIEARVQRLVYRTIGFLGRCPRLA
jgi:hypothetical protein